MEQKYFFGTFEFFFDHLNPAYTKYNEKHFFGNHRNFPYANIRAFCYGLSVIFSFFTNDIFSWVFLLFVSLLFQKNYGVCRVKFNSVKKTCVKFGTITACHLIFGYLRNQRSYHNLWNLYSTVEADSLQRSHWYLFTYLLNNVVSFTETFGISE